MNSVYVEYNTTLIPVPLKRIIMRNFLLALGVSFLVLSLLASYIYIPIAIAFFALAYFYNRGNTFEYEYILLGNEFQVDKIISFAKRKKMFRGLLEYMEIFTNNPALLKTYENRGKKIKKKKYNLPSEKTYVMVLKNENSYNFLYLNADERLIEGIRRVRPLQVKIIK